MEEGGNIKMDKLPEEVIMVKQQGEDGTVNVTVNMEMLEKATANIYRRIQIIVEELKWRGLMMGVPQFVIWNPKTNEITPYDTNVHGVEEFNSDFLMVRVVFIDFLTKTDKEFEVYNRLLSFNQLVSENFISFFKMAQEFHDNENLDIDHE